MKYELDTAWNKMAGDGKAELGLVELTKLVSRLSGVHDPDPQLMKARYPYP